MTIFSDTYNDVYFSAHNGLAEKRYVFLGGNNLPERWQGRSDFVIVEAGFGTGLSVIATIRAFLDTAAPDQWLHILSVEKHPLSVHQMRAALDPWRDEIGGDIDALLSALPPLVRGWHRIILQDRIALTLMIGDVADVLPEIDTSVDAWYLDGFAPAKNPDMWSDTVFEHMRRLSATNATAATYSAARSVRDGLTSAGFNVEKVAGFAHKSDMTRAYFMGTGRPPVCAKRNQKIIIHGGGLAATSAAHAFRQTGQKPLLFAPHGIADAASGNPRGLYNPRFSKNFSAVTPLYAAGFSATAHLVQAESGVLHAHQTGTLHLLHEGVEVEKFTGITTHWNWPDAMAKMVDAQTASDIAGMNISTAALYLPLGGSLDPRALCAFYAANTEKTRALPQDDGGIHVYATGAAAINRIPLQRVRGQISVLKTNPVLSTLKTNLCYGGYVSPAYDGHHVLGSTFQHWLDTGDIRDEDHAYVLDKLAEQVGPVANRVDVIGGRVGFRAAAPDRIPVAGHLEDGGYISAGHGSHGIVTTLIIARALADMIAGTPSCLPQSTLRALDPARFLPAT